MIRSLATAGMILGFIVSAFVPPTDANFRSLSDSAKSQAKVRTAAALLGVSADPAALTATVAALSRTASDPVAVAALQKAGSRLNSAEMQSAIQVLREAAPVPVIIQKPITSVMRTALVLRKTSSYWKQMKQETQDPFLVSRMQDIEWATRKSNARLCRDIALDVFSDAGPTHGDYLALCLAKVTRDPARCKQISETKASLLKKLCTEELTI